MARSIDQVITLFDVTADTVAHTVDGVAYALPAQAGRVIALLNVTAIATEVGDTLSVYVDFSLDGTIWYNAARLTTVLGTDVEPKRYMAILDPANPGTVTFDVSADCSAGAQKPACIGPFIRGRYVTVDAGTANLSATFTLKAACMAS